MCDRCGASVPAKTEKATAFQMAQLFPGWVLADGSRALCPDCAPGYDLLKARHKVELENYLTGE